MSINRQADYVQRKLAKGLCARCAQPRALGDRRLCGSHREEERQRHCNMTRARAKPIPPCETCGAPAIYVHARPTPTAPCSANWRGKVASNALYYCEEHGLAIEAGALPGSIRRL